MTLVEIMGLRHAGLAGWVAGTAWAAASALSVALLVRTARRPGGHWGRLATTLVACIGFGLAASAFLLARARRRMLAIALGLEDPALELPAKFELQLFGALELTEITLFVAGAGLAFCSLVLALTAIFSAAHAEGRPRSAWQRLALVLSVAGLAAAIGLDATRLSAVSPRLRRAPRAGCRGRARVAKLATCR